MNARAIRIGLISGVVAALVLAQAWWLKRNLAEDSCLDKGGTWHAESGTCGGMSTPGPRGDNVVAYEDPIDPVSGYEESCMFDTTHAHTDGRALLAEFLERDSRGDFLQADDWFNGATDCPGHEPGPDAYAVIQRYDASYVQASDSEWVAAVTTVEVGGVTSGGPDAAHPALDFGVKTIVDTVRAIRTPFGWRIISPALRQNVLLSASRNDYVRAWFADTMAKLGIKP